MRERVCDCLLHWRSETVMLNPCGLSNQTRSLQYGRLARVGHLSYWTKFQRVRDLASCYCQALEGAVSLYVVHPWCRTNSGPEQLQRWVPPPPRCVQNSLSARPRRYVHCYPLLLVVPPMDIWEFSFWEKVFVSNAKSPLKSYQTRNWCYYQSFCVNHVYIVGSRCTVLNVH